MATASIQTADILQTPFFSHHPILPELRQAFVVKLWPLSMVTQPDSIDDFDAYFEFIQQEREPSLEQRHYAKTFADILSIVETLVGGFSGTFAELRDSIQSRIGNTGSATPSKISLSLELAVRLWLMSNVRNLMPADWHQLQSSIPWPDALSLKSVLDQQYEWRGGDPGARFPEYLNVYHMNKIAGFRVEWTNSLTLHLAIRGSVIYVFHNVSTLRRMRESLSELGCSYILDEAQLSFVE